MLTAGVSSASQTERSSVLGTVANRSSGRPLARRKCIWIGRGYTTIMAEAIAGGGDVVLAQRKRFLDVVLGQLAW